jgi:hypothetical protein
MVFIVIGMINQRRIPTIWSWIQTKDGCANLGVFYCFSSVMLFDPFLCRQIHDFSYLIRN